MKYNCIIGIDPGATGAISVINNDLKQPYIFDMPKQIEGIKTILDKLKDYNSIVFIEKVSIFFSDNNNPGKQFRIRVLLDNYAALKTVLKLEKVDFIEVTPVQWLKGLGLKNVKDRAERKRRNKLHACYFYPGMKLTISNADSVLIMQYGIMQLSGGIILKKPTEQPKQGKLF